MKRYKLLPNEGDIIETPDGKGTVLSINILQQFIKVAVRKKDQDDTEVHIYSMDELSLNIPKAKNNPCKRCKGNCNRQEKKSTKVEEEE